MAIKVLNFTLTFFGFLFLGGVKFFSTPNNEFSWDFSFLVFLVAFFSAFFQLIDFKPGKKRVVNSCKKEGIYGLVFLVLTISIWILVFFLSKRGGWVLDILWAYFSWCNFFIFLFYQSILRKLTLVSLIRSFITWCLFPQLLWIAKYDRFVVSPFQFKSLYIAEKRILVNTIHIDSYFDEQIDSIERNVQKLKDEKNIKGALVYTRNIYSSLKEKKDVPNISKAKLLRILGTLYQESGHLVKSKDYLWQAILLLSKCSDEYKLFYFNCLRQYSKIVFQLRDFKHTEYALVLRAEMFDGQEQAKKEHFQALKDLGAFYSQIKEFKKSLRIVEKALELGQFIYGKESAQVKELRKNMFFIKKFIQQEKFLKERGETRGSP